ncbi:hypothetical protein D3Z38_02790 [Clostridiales bacterium]|nr:hypothetical protein [Clostridiales bacterium]
MSVMKRTSRILSMVVVFLMAMTVVPMTQGTGKAHAAAAQPQAVRIELVNAPEGQEFYLGLDEDALLDMLYDKLKVRIIFRDGSEDVIGADSFIDVNQNQNIYASTSVAYNADEESESRWKEGKNQVVITYREWSDNEDRDLQRLKASFTLTGVRFKDYDPSLENDKNLTAQISEWGNQILFENGELWKAPMNSVRYERKSDIQGIVADVYNSIRIDSQDVLTVENKEGKVCGTLNDVRDFGKGYALQKDGTLQYVPYWDNDWEVDSGDSEPKTSLIAKNIQRCVPAGGYGNGGVYYAIDNTGNVYRYQYRGVGKAIEKSSIEEMERVTDLVWLDWRGVYYLTASNQLKWFDSEENKSEKIMDGVERISGRFAIGTDGNSYSIENGAKILDTEIVAEKQGGYYSDDWYAADGRGRLYSCGYDYSGDETVQVTHLVATDFKEFSTFGYIANDGTQKGLPYWNDEKKVVVENNVLIDLGGVELRADGTVYLTSYNFSCELLTNVVNISGNSGCLIMARKDGTVWLFDKSSYFGEERNRIAIPQKLSQKLLDETFNVKQEKRDVNELAYSYEREVAYTGKEVKPAITIEDYDYVLRPGTDYDVTYKNNINEGTATMTVVGKGDYIGKRDLLFTIKKMNITQNTPVSPNKKNQAIHGASKFTKVYGSKPFYLGAKTTGKGKLTYKSNNRSVIQINQAGKATIKGPGRAIITVTAAATANYNAATKQVLITVKPKKATGLKVKAAKKKMTVRWKRDPKADGYQLTYAQNSKFKKGKKNILIRKNKIIKQVIKKVKPKKTYYVKVRAYKKVGKAKLYGAYSKAKKVKIPR